MTRVPVPLQARLAALDPCSTEGRLRLAALTDHEALQLQEQAQRQRKAAQWTWELPSLLALSGLAYLGWVVASSGQVGAVGAMVAFALMMLVLGLGVSVAVAHLGRLAWLTPLGRTSFTAAEVAAAAAKAPAGEAYLRAVQLHRSLVYADMLAVSALAREGVPHGLR